VPAVEAGVSLGFVFGRDDGLVELLVGGVVEAGMGNTLVIGDSAVTDELDLGDSWDAVHLEQAGGDLRDRGVEGMTISIRCGIEGLNE